MYDVGVIVGRFQPLGNGHVEFIRRGFDHCRNLIILIGKTRSCKDIMNPWSPKQVRDTIARIVIPKGKVLHVDYIEDVRYDDELWCDNLCVKIAAITSQYSAIKLPKVVLISGTHGKSSHWISRLNTFDHVQIPTAMSDDTAQLRELLLAGRNDWNSGQHVPGGTLAMINEWQRSQDYRDMRESFDAIMSYRRHYEDSSTSTQSILVAADALVTCNHHVLLVKRGGWPYKGTLALPGGFVNNDERIVDAAIRECVENTGLDKAMLYQHLTDMSGYYDDPDRDHRHRIVSNAFRIDLPGTEMPTLTSGDDAGSAWYQIDTIAPYMMYGDHYDIIHELLL